MHRRPSKKQGFTLIELSIVVVIIGLIVGGVLVGQDMIKAAQARAQITQIEKFQSAVATFYEKYQALPGDLNAATASQFGFSPRGQYAGEGDGNGIIQGNWGNCTGCNNGHFTGAGEPVLFWMDLSQAGLIEGSFTGRQRHWRSDHSSCKDEQLFSTGENRQWELCLCLERNGQPDYQH